MVFKVVIVLTQTATDGREWNDSATRNAAVGILSVTIDKPTNGHFQLTLPPENHSCKAQTNGGNFYSKLVAIAVTSVALLHPARAGARRVINLTGSICRTP